MTRGNKKVTTRSKVVEALLKTRGKTAREIAVEIGSTKGAVQAILENLAVEKEINEKVIPPVAKRMAKRNKHNAVVWKKI